MADKSLLSSSTLQILLLHDLTDLQVPYSTLFYSFLEDLKRQATINMRQNPWECGGIGRRAGLKIRRAI